MRESKFSFRQLSLGELSFPSFFCFAKMQTTATQTTARGRNITQTEKQNKKRKSRNEHAIKQNFAIFIRLEGATAQARPPANFVKWAG